MVVVAPKMETQKTSVIHLLHKSKKAMTTTKTTTIPSAKELIEHTKPYAKEERGKSWFYTLSTLAYLVLSLMGAFFDFHWASNFIFSVLSGLLIVRFFIIYHDYLHGAILQDSWLAKFIMTVFGLFVLAPTTIWKRTHDHHHHHNSKLTNSGIGSYPLLSKEKFIALSKQEKFIYLAARNPFTIFFGYITLFIFDFNVKSLINSPKTHWDSFVALVLHLTIAYLLFHFKGLETLIYCSTIPFMIANGMGAYLFYAQHNFPGATFDDNKNWDYARAAINSTSYLVMNPVMNWFTGNIGYHHVHHANHKIPFYKLKSAMEGISELQHPITTTLKIKDVVACLRLKIWDPGKGEMTGL